MWGRYRGRCGDVCWGVGEVKDVGGEMVVLGVLEKVRRGVGETWGSVLGCGESERRCGEECWGVGQVRGDVERSVGVFEGVGKDVGTCVGCGARCMEVCGGMRKCGKKWVEVCGHGEKWGEVWGSVLGLAGSEGRCGEYLKVWEEVLAK